MQNISILFSQEDSPLTEHRKFYPYCQFVRGLEVGNIQITDQANSDNRLSMPTALQVEGGHDECGIRMGLRDANSGPEKGNSHETYLTTITSKIKLD